VKAGPADLPIAPVAFATLLIASIGTGYWFGRTRLLGVGASGGLRIAPSETNLGEQWEQPALEKDLTLYNDTSRPIQVKDFRTDCSCLNLEPRAILLQPRSTATVKARLDLLIPRNESRQFDDFSVTFDPVLAEGPSRVTGWQLTGRIRVPLLRSPDEVDFGRVPSRGPPIVKDVELTCLSPVVDVATTDPNAAIVCRLERLERGAATHRLHVTLDGPRQLGKATASVILEPLLANAQRLPGIPIACGYDVVGSVDADRTEYEFQSVRVGETRRESCVLQSLVGAPFQVTDITTPPNISAVRALELDSPHRFQQGFVISLSPTEPGLLHEKVHFGWISTHPDGSTETGAVVVAVSAIAYEDEPPMK
jgi:hypothetical protein